jgi:hypothetical protein
MLQLEGEYRNVRKDIGQDFENIRKDFEKCNLECNLKCNMECNLVRAINRWPSNCNSEEKQKTKRQKQIFSNFFIFYHVIRARFVLTPFLTHEQRKVAGAPSIPTS